MSTIDLHGKWVVIRTATKEEKGNSKSTVLLIKCVDCGAEKFQRKERLTNPNVCKNCERLELEINYVGKRYGKWVILRLATNEESGIKDSGTKVLARCDCGVEKFHKLDTLTTTRAASRSTQCLACAQKEGQRKLTEFCARNGISKRNLLKAIEKNKKHGHSGHINRTRTYRSWEAMKRRCDNPNAKGYHNYGGRGIKVCQKFRDFEGFLEVLGERPENTSIDRIDADGNYSCGECQECLESGWVLNCQWATPIQQRANQRVICNQS